MNAFALPHLILGLAATLGAVLAGTAGRAEPALLIAMHGKPTLPNDFKNLAYANPNAPKGGRLTWGLLGTFDSLNPFIVRGIAVQQIRGYVVESLMARNNDEPFSLYGLLADRIDTDDTRSYVAFHINPAARFSDGTPVTAQDVLFSWRLLRDHGRPNHRLYYSKVKDARVVDAQTVRFDFGGEADRELPLILGLMPIFAEHAVNVDTFEDTSMSAPLGSGPYRVADVRPGASVTMKRNPDYWGRDLPVNRGLWNFDEVRLDFYREANGAFEAFKRGLYDFRVETEPLRWHEGYDFPAARTGEVIRDTIKTGTPRPSEFLVFNTRRPVFADIHVRQALTLLFDFEWINRNYFFGLYSRSPSYFAGSELSAEGRPASAREREILAPYPASIRPDIMDGRYRLPVSDGSGRDRKALRAALTLLEQAGYAFKGTHLRNHKTGEPLTFEILVSTRDQERIALAYSRDLKRAGINVSVRVVDAVQFDQRRLAYDFDMIQNRWDQSLSPGNEQAFYWGSQAADTPGTRNYMGAHDPAIDAAINAMLGARERPDFVDAVRALDRVLMSGAYAIPLYNAPAQWIARWNRIKSPPRAALSGYLPETWWFNSQKQTPVTDATDTPDSSVSMPDRSPTLYDLFSRTAERTPDALALRDPPNKRRITGEEPVELTYAQAEIAVASLSSQFIRAGLPAGSIVAVQLPNTIEFPLTLLAAWRAGLVVALLPQLWRQAELAEALNRVGARAVITAGRIELIDHADLAMNAAAEAFSIRHVMGFGEALPDGMTPLDWRQRESFAPNLSINARKAAVASFDITRNGMIAVPRSHVNLIAGGLAIYMESALPSAAQIVSTALLSSFAGLTSSIVLWLLSGGSLHLHHPFDPQVLAEQIRTGNCDTLIAPAELALRMSESSAIEAQPSLRHIIGLWRTPERVAASLDWKAKSAALTDVYLFGEMGLFAFNRLDDGAAAPVTLTHHDAARAGELLLTPKGTLGLRGPMLSLAAYRPPPKADASLMSAEPSVDYVDTGYPAKREGQDGHILLTGTPAGIANVGGYRFREDDLEQWARRLAPGTVMMALPDPINGFRLAGRSSENARARGVLAELGLNPLMTEAFRQRERQA